MLPFGQRTGEEAHPCHFYSHRRGSPGTVTQALGERAVTWGDTGVSTDRGFQSSFSHALGPQAIHSKAYFYILGLD